MARGHRSTHKPKRRAEAQRAKEAAAPTSSRRNTSSFSPSKGAVRGNKFKKVVSAIKRNGNILLAIPGVISIRPGYRFKNGWLTAEPAVVVGVRRKLRRSLLLVKERVPASIDNVPVDVEVAFTDYGRTEG